MSPTERIFEHYRERVVLMNEVLRMILYQEERNIKFELEQYEGKDKNTEIRKRERQLNHRLEEIEYYITLLKQKR